MVATHDPHDEPFFREWNTHRHVTRSRTRTTQLQHALGLTRTLPTPAILIVGSKGKGTATAAATSALAKNATVGTITSPPLRHNRERIRINGRAISHTEYARLSEIAHDAIRTLPPVTDGYLPPSGIYTQTGIAYLLQQGVDFLVIEEGLGGLSDDVSLFDYPTVGITQIFMEHSDILGNSLSSITHDLLGTITPATTSIVSHYNQPQEVWDYLAGRDIELPELELPEPELVQASTMTATNLEIGARAAATLRGRYVPIGEQELILPARASTHTPPHSDALWMVDAGINPEGIQHALTRATEELGHFHVLAGLPDVKDVDACLEVLEPFPVTFVGAGRDYLDYTHLAAHGPVLKVEDACEQALASGKNILAVGTMSVAGAVLELLDAPTHFWW
ncbi:bifunctional protein FolC [Brevibacterium mcbrellneri ATCC 49030]|uniref:Bifunctional protein FolC n=1 Tax=Brevibacterium mcbrellneri ATCC 49030 TaxID=585530 RepID=D4YLM0_9MICO|nr:hypothetical protein [Brevibacterium mcbrellneri]EFG47937.1 bifunctional protein FolC [Brevibacterium mcbrellneri ATCC 49030]